VHAKHIGSDIHATLSSAALYLKNILSRLNKKDDDNYDDDDDGGNDNDGGIGAR
jgi:hypothetical protein